MDQDRLAKLRQRYAGAGGGDIHDPHFAKVAAAQFTGDKRKWPFADVATFVGAPYRPDALSAPGLGGLDVAIIGVPMDLGVTNRAGARLGPRAVRAIERMGPMDHVLGTAPFTMLRAADIGDVPFRSRYSLENCHEDIEATFRTDRRGRRFAAGRRRRPFHHLFDPEGGRREAPGRHGPYRRPLRYIRPL